VISARKKETKTQPAGQSVLKDENGPKTGNKNNEKSETGIPVSGDNEVAADVSLDESEVERVIETVRELRAWQVDIEKLPEDLVQEIWKDGANLAPWQVRDLFFWYACILEKWREFGVMVVV
jgi:hypothetical protein